MYLPREFIIVMGLMVLLLSNMISTKVILIGGILVMYYVYDHVKINKSFREVMNNVSDVNEERNKYVIKEDGHKFVYDTHVHMDEKVDEYMRKIKKYRRYNKDSYDKGNNHMVSFIKNIYMIESGAGHSRQLYENAETHYREGVKYFRSIILSIPIMTFGQSLVRQYKDHMDILGNLCKELEEYCYVRLYNISLHLNKDWLSEPDIYKTEIINSEIRAANSHNNQNEL